MVAKSKKSLERAVMNALWSHGEGSVREVLERLQQPYAYTTILTVLDRLHAKGAVGRQKVDGAWRYWARRSQGATAGHAVASLLQDLEGDPEPVLLAFLDQAERMDPDVLDRLEALIRRRRRSAK
jgi:predicted transcriptional regulator